MTQVNIYFYLGDRIPQIEVASFQEKPITFRMENNLHSTINNDPAFLKFLNFLALTEKAKEDVKEARQMEEAEASSVSRNEVSCISSTSSIAGANLTIDSQASVMLCTKTPANPDSKLNTIPELFSKQTSKPGLKILTGSP